MANAVCVYVRDEAENILEWIVYNFVIGFDTVIVMDNHSTDGTRSIAESCQRHLDVRVEQWADTSPRAQMNCYDHVLRTYGPQFEWIAFIDSDEFIVPMQHPTITALLQTIPGHGAIGLNWAIFGSDGHADIAGRLVTESFRRRAPDDFAPNRHIKSIVRPARTLSCAHPHLFHLDDERTDEQGRYRSDYVHPNGQPILWGAEPGLTSGVPDLSVCRLHHYFTRSLAHWDRKLQRGWRDTTRGYEAFNEYDRNEVLDGAIDRFLPELKLKLATMG